MSTLSTEHRTSTLHELLDAELAYSPSYLGRYSSHLAMALVALHQMGAPPETLRATFDRTVEGGIEARTDVALLDERVAEVARDGIEAVVRARVPALADAPGSQLFHPVIRLGYAIEVGHPGQVAAALLDWERRYHGLLPSTTRGTRRLAEVADDLATSAAGAWASTFDLDAVAGRPEVQRALEGLAVDAATLDDVSGFALAAHATADDFVTLHLVTGARGVRVVAGLLGDEAVVGRLAGAAARDAAVAYAAIGAPRLLDDDALDDLRAGATPDRSDIVRLATTSHDPHVIKLAQAALAEERRTGDPLHRLLAARVVGLA